MPHSHPLSVASLALAVLLTAGVAPGQNARSATVAPAGSEGPKWRSTEDGILRNQVQLTFADRFVKAGESYFSPDDSRVIFQAVEVPPNGQAADEFYAMFVGDVARDARGRITALDDIRRVSPAGSANTCGWFDPVVPDRILFASTLDTPSESTPPGYQRASGRYRWMFPPEMRIVTRTLTDDFDPDTSPIEVIYRTEGAYAAECSVSRDGRHLLFCSLESNDGDLFVGSFDATGKLVRRAVIDAPGYDGGPFFSPDTRRICYRSDRRNNHYLQIFVADLEFDADGVITGVEREYQLTDNEHVNWCPFWHPDGRHLVYATSEMGHQNYEVFLVDADPGNLARSDGPIRYGTRKRQVTNAEGADVLPAFNSNGRTMIWTSQRGEKRTSQLWAAEFVIDVDAAPVPGEETTRTAPASTVMNVTDPETGLIYIYDRASHDLSVYDPSTHQKSPVDDPKTIQRVMELFRTSGN